MSDDINKLIGRLRSYVRSSKYIITEDIFAAADALEDLAEWRRQALALEATWDVQAVGRLIKVPLGGNILPAIQPALEALEGEVEKYRERHKEFMTLQNALERVAGEKVAAEAERDRLKAALETIAEGCDSGRHDGLPEEHPAHDADIMHYIACEALEGREWERLGNEKVGTHGSPEMNKTLEGMETERKRVVVDSQGFCDDTAPMRAALLWLADNFTLNAQTSTLIELPTKQPGSQLVHSGLLVAAALRQIARGGQG